MEWNQILYLKPSTYKLPRYRPIYLFHLQEITSGSKPPSSLYRYEFDFLRRFKGLKSEQIQKYFDEHCYVACFCFETLFLVRLEALQNISPLFINPSKTPYEVV